MLFEPVDGSPADRRVVGEQAKAVLSQFPSGGKGDQFQAAVIADGLNVVPVILPGIGQLDLQPVIADLLGLFAKLLNGPPQGNRRSGRDVIQGTGNTVAELAHLSSFLSVFLNLPLSG